MPSYNYYAFFLLLNLYVVYKAGKYNVVSDETIITYPFIRIPYATKI